MSSEIYLSLSSSEGLEERRDWSPYQWLPREVTASRGGGRAVTFRIVRTVRRGRRAK